MRPFLALTVVILVMVAATLVEKITGSAADIYGSWWFAALWAILAVMSAIYMLRRKLQRRPFVLLLHLSMLVILVGAGLTHFWGKQGVLHIRIGDEVNYYKNAEGMREDLPFAVRLQDFQIQYYPGTQTPMDFVSTIKVGDDTWEVAMNKIADVHNYRIYQSAYDEDMQGTILSVSYDPWGIGVTYVGYGMLFVSMLLLLILPNEGFRRALRRLSAIALIAWATTASAQAAPHVVPDSIAERMCDMYCYYNGRICPLQTVARDFTTKFYGKPSYMGYSAEQVFSSWMVWPTEWSALPRKKAKNERAADEQRAIEQMFMNGHFLKIFPYDGHWYSFVDRLPEDMDGDAVLFIKKSLDYVCELIITRQYDQVGYTLGKIRRYQEKYGGDGLPSDASFRAEKVYNQYNFTRPLAMALATLGIVAFFLYLMCWVKGKPVYLWVRVATLSIVIVVSLYLMALSGLRWYVSGHLPLTNGYETMQFLALVTLLLTMLLRRKFVLVMPFGLLLSGLALLVSMMGQSNPRITPLMPVLDSPLLSSHVCIIMIAYSLLAFTFFNGLTSLLLPLMVRHDAVRRTEIDQQLANVTQLLLYPALFCMAAGIFIGAIWANVSWGRYWGWDPKEVWALITLLVYCFALHSQSLPWFRRPRHLHLFMVLAFLTVLMTYFGVNFLLGGMHSYANS
ncbi:MAG: cytochrome c biogenesis protein CcsA [Bacteroidales bacterium]|nr:cytochrome c biogenesis protein CcsA [Bacteroidales bacterium]